MAIDFKLRGWIRAATKKSENNQRAALAEIGCTKLFVDGDDTLDDLLRDLRKGETVCVTTFGRISSHRVDLAPFRKAVHAKHATILEVSTGRRSDNADDMAEMMADAAAELTGEARALTPHEAVRNGYKGGVIKGKNASKKRTTEAQAKSVWYDPRLTNAQVKSHPDFRGWTASTAYRKFKSRGISSGPRKPT